MNKKIDYKIRSSRRAKRLRLAVYCDGRIVVTKPKNVSLGVVEKFVAQKTDWLATKLSFFRNLTKKIPPASQEDFINKKDKAFKVVKLRIEKFGGQDKFNFNKINIKNQKTRWGSCSKKRNLNFNYRLVYLPNKMIDYVVAHELCHLREFNHSKKFWSLVARLVPDYLEIRESMKEFI